ncbi:hypothetical protein [Streptomyces sp. NBC_00105]|uniref:hypothetical protein n=1 Tax=Streptomyces sp. NBC_00105 TaxID=2903622 RepID=UPI0032495117
MARSRLTGKKQLADLAGVGRTTVHAVFKDDGPVPSEHTVAALARELRLPVEDLLQLRRAATAASRTPSSHEPALGKPISGWEPHDLEIHPAGPPAPDGPGLEATGRQVLPGYVRRAHDQVLAKAVRDVGKGISRMLVLVGTSSTGKTRACWEAVQPLADRGWRLWHPFDQTRAEAAREDLHRVQPRTVVWLNEAQHYLGSRTAGERIAAAVHQLLVTPERGPVLVLGTLWPEYAHQYTTLPSPGGEDPHSRARELLSGRTLTVPDSFDAPALAAAAALAESGDRLLADTLTRAHTDGRITQDLAGAPELLNRYQHATPAAKALLEAAIDARRLGVGLHLPQAFLTDAARDYLSQSDYDQLSENWAEAAFAELARTVHGKQAPLRRTIPRPPRRPPTPSTATLPAPRPAGPMFRLADYLEQHGRTTHTHLCPPSSFWHAAHTHLAHPDDLDNLAQAADARHRLQWAHHLDYRAAEYGDTRALVRLAVRREEAGGREGAELLARQAADRGDTDALVHLAVRREEAGDRQGAETLYQQAADHGDSHATYLLAVRREEARDQQGAETLYQQAADHGDTRALYSLAEIREKAGDREGAELLARQAADRGDTYALCLLALRRKKAGDRQGAETLYQQAADHGDTDARNRLAEIREKAGDRQGAETLYQQAADHGDTRALYSLAEIREKAGDRQGAETLCQQAAADGDTDALFFLAVRREGTGDRQGAETLYQQAADRGDTRALYFLAVRREEAGDREGAELLARQAADRGDTDALFFLAVRREEAGDRQGAETLYQQAADHGGPHATYLLAVRREEAGDRQGAETVYRQAADHGDTDALVRLAVRREEARDRQGASLLARQAADHGDPNALNRWSEMAGLFKRLWPFGLDPDGTPTPRWQ